MSYYSRSVSETDCKCDYSFICNACQKAIDEENQREYDLEMKEWLIEAIVDIAKQANISLKEPPKKRGRY